MRPASVDVNPVAHAVRRLFRFLILGIRDGQAALEDQMGCQACVAVWWVVFAVWKLAGGVYHFSFLDGRLEEKNQEKERKEIGGSK